MNEKYYWHSDIKILEVLKKRDGVITKVDNEERFKKHQRSDPNLIDFVFVVVLGGFVYFFLCGSDKKKMNGVCDT